jgi:hypothetical protein
MSQLLKYLLEGLAVALAAFFIPGRKIQIIEIVYIGLCAAATFSILDMFSPATGAGTRQGAGFGIGLNTVGWGNAFGGRGQIAGDLETDNIIEGEDDEDFNSLSRSRNI